MDVTASFSPLAFSDVRFSAATGFLSPTQRVMNTVFTQNQMKNQVSELSATLFSHMGDVQLSTVCC